MKKRLSVSLAALAVSACMGAALYGQGKEMPAAPRQVHTAYPAAVSSEGDMLSKQFPVPRRPEDVASFHMDTPEKAYHFIRTQQGVCLDGCAADAEGFEGMLQLFFELPVEEYAAQQMRSTDEMTLTLGYSDGTQNRLSIGFDEEDAWMCMDAGKSLRTDAWRIHALLIACDGARLNE